MKLSKDEQIFVERMAQGLAAWEAFPADGRALVVGEAPGMAQMLRKRSLSVVEATSSEVLSGTGNVADGAFDVVLMVAEPERVKEPVGLLSACHALLAPHGRLLLGMNNRLGFRYFCGDADIYTDRSFDGIDDYQQVQDGCRPVPRADVQPGGDPPHACGGGLRGAEVLCRGVRSRASDAALCRGLSAA